MLCRRITVICSQTTGVGGRGGEANLPLYLRAVIPKVFSGSKEIRDQFQRYPWIHFSNVYFELILVINQLDAQNFCFTVSLFHASTCFEQHVLIIRRPKLHYTASGIITPVGGRPVHRLREDSQPVHRTASYTVWWYQTLYNTILTSWWWAHVAWNM